MKRWAIALAALAAVVALPSLANGFVYDDVPIIVQNARVHRLFPLDTWTGSYWPAGGLYRPLTIQIFSLEWALGGGKPLIFHAVSVFLTALTALLVYRLAVRLLPPAGALIAGALFAVHPVHVEAVANAVGQSELLATAFALFAVERYLSWREAGRLTAGHRVLLAGCTLLAIAAKETGYVIPLLLVAAELSRPRLERRSARGVFAWQFGTVVSALLIRLIALGTLAGETPSASFQGLSNGRRALGMLLVVPEWARLLVWPVRLSAEYGPPGLALDAAFGPAHLLGLSLLGAAVAGVVLSWRRNRSVAFALLWMAIALLPVANLFAASGLVLAERTLFLPSVGVALLAGALGNALWEAVSAGPVGQRVMFAAIGAALLLGAGVRNVLRQGVWRSEGIFFDRIATDAPDSYRAHLMASRYLYGIGRYGEAEAAARTALALYHNDPRVHEQLGQLLRVQGRCAEALPVLAEGVARFPDATTARSRLIECALAVGDSARARTVAEDAVAMGQSEFESSIARLKRRP